MNHHAMRGHHLLGRSRSASQQVDIVHAKLIVKQIPNGTGSHLHVGVGHVAVLVERIVTLPNPIPFKHYSPGPRRTPVHHAQAALHLIVSYRFVGEKLCRFRYIYMHNQKILNTQTILPPLPGHMLQRIREIEKQLAER